MEPRTQWTVPRFGPRPTVAEALERPRAWYRRHRRLRVVFFITLAFVAVFALLANVADEQAKLEEGSWEYSGTLTESDWAFEDGSGTFDIWFVDLVEGQTLRIEMRSEDLAPDFYVLGPMSDDAPRVVAESEDGGDGAARGEFAASPAGEYAVVVPSYGPDARGAYRLTSNYRLADLEGSDEIEGGAEVLLMLFVLLWLAQLTGLPAFLFWRHPDRILLLRPFGEKHISRSLKKLNRNTLAYRGFTFTLADKHLKDSLTAYLLANVPVDLGSLAVSLYRPLFRRLHRFILVRKPGGLRLLQLRLRSRFRLGYFWQSWLGIGDRINKFRSRDELWKDCIDILLDNCQVIVADVSQAGEGTSWEIEEIFRRGYLYRTVFLVRDDADDVRAAEELIGRIAAELGAREDTTPILFRYSTTDGSLVEQEAFEQAYAEAASSERQPQPADLPVSRKALLSLAPMAVLGPFWSPIGLVLAILALRDIHRADGMLGGEMLAHLAILLDAAILGLIAAVAVYVGATT